VEEVQNDFVSPLFLAAVESVEEAVYNSLTRATTVTGNGKTLEAIPLDRLRAILAERKK
jgi:D-aminopeptidase